MRIGGFLRRHQGDGPDLTRFSWVARRRHLRTPPWQVASAIVLGSVALWALGAAPAAISALYVAAVTTTLVLTDLREHRLPNRMVVPGIAVGMVAATLQWSPVPIVAGAAYGGFLFVLGLRGGIGMGDVKLAVVLGLASPTAAMAFTAATAAFMLGGVAASIALMRRGRGTRLHPTRLAFGPWMLAGYWVAVVLAIVSGSAVGAP